jgi:hypothetical protein
MSRDRRIRFTIKFDNMAGAIEWKRPEMGAPNAANLAKVAAVYDASLQPGGCNDYINLTSFGGAILIDTDAPIGERVIASYHASE